MEASLGTIYKITNKINNKVYIGFDSNWPTRMKYHLQHYNKTAHYDKLLYKAFRKYGIESFEFTVLYQSWDVHHCLNVMESFFIEEHRSFIGYHDGHGYNSTLGGEGSLGSPRPKSREWRHIHTAFMQESNPAAGREYNEEERAHRSKKTREYYQNHPDKKLTGSRNPMYGKTHTDEVKQRIAETSKLRFNLVRDKILKSVSCSFCSRTLTIGNLKRHENVCERNPNRVDKRTGREPMMCLVCNCTTSPYKYKKYHQHTGDVNVTS